VERNLLGDPVLNLESPAVSPDGRFAAVVRTTSGVRGEIALYDLATGALVRLLTSGPSEPPRRSRRTARRSPSTAREQAGARSGWCRWVVGARAG
jgi:hypothetical protein